MNLLLRRLEKLVDLSESDCAALEILTRSVQHVRPREDLVSDGDNPQCVNFILDGWACRYKQLSDGRRQIISLFVPGDMCDPMIYMFRKMSHSIGSLTPVTIARLTGEEMRAVTTQHPTIATAFWLDMLISAETQREWSVCLGSRTATERMAHLFCEIPLRLEEVGLSDGKECEFPLTQSDLADAIGLSTVHVNRTLQELRSKGLVELKAKRLTVHDTEALWNLAMFDPSYLHH